jgi:hypothetical protein
VNIWYSIFQIKGTIEDADCCRDVTRQRAGTWNIEIPRCGKIEQLRRFRRVMDVDMTARPFPERGFRALRVGQRVNGKVASRDA